MREQSAQRAAVGPSAMTLRAQQLELELGVLTDVAGHDEHVRRPTDGFLPGPAKRLQRATESPGAADPILYWDV